MAAPILAKSKVDGNSETLTADSNLFPGFGESERSELLGLTSGLGSKITNESSNQNNTPGNLRSQSFSPFRPLSSLSNSGTGAGITALHDYLSTGGKPSSHVDADFNAFLNDEALLRRAQTPSLDSASTFHVDSPASLMGHASPMTGGDMMAPLTASSPFTPLLHSHHQHHQTHVNYGQESGFTGAHHADSASQYTLPTIHEGTVHSDPHSTATLNHQHATNPAHRALQSFNRALDAHHVSTPTLHPLASDHSLMSEANLDAMHERALSNYTEYSASSGHPHNMEHYHHGASTSYPHESDMQHYAQYDYMCGPVSAQSAHYSDPSFTVLSSHTAHSHHSLAREPVPMSSIVVKRPIKSATTSSATRRRKSAADTNQERPAQVFMCSFPDCGKTFSRFYNLKSHQRTVCCRFPVLSFE